MDVSYPFGGLFPGTESSVLRVLAKTNVYLSGSEIARQAGVSHPTAIRVLRRFVSQGLVNDSEAGRAQLYVLNREHLAAKPLLDLVYLKSKLTEYLAGAFASWDIVPMNATLFGSMARGEGDATSDIDLLVVRPESVPIGDRNWEGETYVLTRTVYGWTGNQLALIEVGEEELESLSARRPSVVEEVTRDGIHVFGTSFSKLMGRR